MLSLDWLSKKKVSFEHFVDNLETNILMIISAEEYLLFNKRNMEFWVINFFFYNKRISGLWSDLHSIHYSIVIRIINWHKSISLFMPEIHCLDNESICAMLFTGIVLRIKH